MLDFSKPFQVKCDVSGQVISNVLIQEDNPIAYFNEKLDESRRNYTSYDKEFYVVVQALKKGRHYLMSKEYFLYIDNHALQIEYIMQQNKLSQNHVKWIEYLQNFTFFKAY